MIDQTKTISKSLEYLSMQTLATLVWDAGDHRPATATGLCAEWGHTHTSAMGYPCLFFLSWENPHLSRMPFCLTSSKQVKQSKYKTR